MKLPPASRNAWMIRRLSCSLVGAAAEWPNIRPPRQALETCRPAAPRGVYCIVTPAKTSMAAPDTSALLRAEPRYLDHQAAPRLPSMVAALTVTDGFRSPGKGHR